MKFLLIIDSLGSGGAERQCVALALVLKQKGHHVVMLGYAKGDHFFKDINKAGISYSLLEERNPVWRILKFRKKIREHRPDVIIAFLQTSAILAELASVPKKTWKLIVSERNNISYFFSFRTRIVLQFHRLADQITTNSESSTSAIVENAHFLKNKIHTIYNGLDLERFRPPDRYVQNTRKKLIVIASHQKHKNAKNLILALAKLKSLSMNSLPVIYWYGSDVSYSTGIPCDTYFSTLSMINDYRLNDDFILEDPVADIENIYRSSDGLILSSFWEGLPNAVCEAMACGLPILMSMVSDYKILTDGNGTCFDPNSVDSIADAISWFCKLDENEIMLMRSISRKKAENLFSLDNMCESYLKLVEIC
jgi:glycosyltransferase involved in cell wall biosynthesis